MRRQKAEGRGQREGKGVVGADGVVGRGLSESSVLYVGDMTV